MKLAIVLATAGLVVGPAAALAQGAPATPSQSQRFRSTMDHVFGPGEWRETSGYRSQAREDELRRQGAGTVPAGVISHHSMGSPDAPGAYDVVVPGMSTRDAAIKLESSGAPMARVIAERAHGEQGSHLHIEPDFSHGSDAAMEAAPAAPDDSSIYLRVVNGRRNPLLLHAPHARRHGS
ncbi:MAG: hypothetical protein ACREEB_15020 [Caulobacteraceae bacterium]